jgi:hypothetical protein
MARSFGGIFSTGCLLSRMERRERMLFPREYYIELATALIDAEMKVADAETLVITVRAMAIPRDIRRDYALGLVRPRDPDFDKQAAA